MRLSLLAILPLLPALLSACGGESVPTPTPPDPPPPVAAEAFMGAYANALCDRAARCLSVASYLDPACEDGVRQSFGDEVTKAIAAGRIAYDAAAAGECLAGLAATDCLASQLTDATLTSCLSALTGKVAQGQPCLGTFECAAGTCPSVSGDTCPTVCPAVAKAGEACSYLSGPDCDVRAGLRCSSGTCVLPTTDGGSCVDNYGCKSGLVCVENKCGPLRGEGDGCGADSSCAQGFFCVSGGDEGGVCEARVALGGQCGQEIEDTAASSRHVQCVEGLVCKGAGLTDAGAVVAGACVKPTDLDGACTVEPAGMQLFWGGCLDGLICNAGKCAKPPATGEPCGPHSACRAHEAYCDPKTTACTALKANGATCLIDPECLGGYCGSKGTCTDEATFCAP